MEIGLVCLACFKDAHGENGRLKCLISWLQEMFIKRPDTSTWYKSYLLTLLTLWSTFGTMEVHLLYYVSCDAVWGGLCESVLLTVLQLTSRWCCITYTGRMLMSCITKSSWTPGVWMVPSPDLVVQSVTSKTPRTPMQTRRMIFHINGKSQL